MNRTPTRLATALLLGGTLLLSACMHRAPDRNTNTLTADLPGRFMESSGTNTLHTTWWTVFESPQLNRLIERAFADNLTLEQAAARLEQAEAIYRKSGADVRPKLEGRAGASSAYDSRSATTDPRYSAGLYASYEIDLWGRIRSSKKAAEANFQASALDLQAAAMTLAAEVAKTYFDWQAQSQTLVIYQRQLEINRDKLAALETRYKTGQNTSLAVLQQRQQTAAAEARIPQARATLQTTRNRLAILLGKPPNLLPILFEKRLPSLPPLPKTGIPIDLLKNRPDLQAARLRLEAADWSVNMAKAARLPALSLTGNLTTSDERVEALFDDWASHLAANLVAPLLDGGTRKAEVWRAEAVAREQVAAYRLRILDAIQETEEALQQEHHQQTYMEALEKQYTAAQHNARESLLRYQRGVLPFLDALTASVSRDALEVTQLQAHATLLKKRIQLYRALGGDWTFILEENP